MQKKGNEKSLTVLLKRANEPNVNGISYSEEALESIHEQIQNNKGKIFGELGQDDVKTTTEEENRILSVQDSKYIDSSLFVNIDLLDKDIDLNKKRVAIRGMGQIIDGVVQKDAKIIAVDLVSKRS